MKPLPSSLVLEADAAIDLQMHTTFSDGTWTAEQLIDYLVSEQFGLVAITDHERVDTAAALQQLAAQKQLPILPAVEMSASWRGELTDVLCYGFEPEQNELYGVAQDIARRQRENTKEVCENLRQSGYALYQEYARTHHLLTSSGSDSHGPAKKPIKYRAELSRSLLERLGVQINAH